MHIFPTSFLGIILPAAVSFLAFWLFFQAPLGRRKTTVKRTIKASAAEVWRRVDPESLDFSWNPHWEQHDARKIGDDPLTLEYLVRPRGAKGGFYRRKESWTRIEPGAHVTSCVLGFGDIVIEPSALSFEHLDLVEVAGETRAALTAEGPVRGIYGYEMRRLALAKYLAALNAAARGRTAAKIPLIRFTGWRFAALAFFSAVLWLGWPTSESASGSASGGAFRALLVALLVPLTLVAAVVLHEIGHALALVATGRRNVAISLIPFFGGVAVGPREYDSEFESGFVAIAGIAFSTLICLALLPCFGYLDNLLERLLFSQGADRAAVVAALRHNPLPWIALCAFAVVAWQLAVNIFNILPFPGSDGWQFLQSLFSSRSMQWSAAACVVAIFVVLSRSLSVVMIVAAFSLLPAIANWPSKKPPPRFARATGEWRRLALAGIFLGSSACLGYEAGATQAFMSRTTSLFAHCHASDAKAPMNEGIGDCRLSPDRI